MTLSGAEGTDGQGKGSIQRRQNQTSEVGEGLVVSDR